VTAKIVRALVAFGANLGDPQSQLGKALNQLQHGPRISVVRTSSLYSTIPAGGPDNQTPYLNAAASLTTDLTATELLNAVHQVEQAAGRVRAEPWSPRTLDIDVLFLDDEVQRPNSVSRPGTQGELVLPHARMAWRRFVMDPAAEIEPDWIHPLLGRTLHSLRQRLVECTNFAVVARDIRQGKRIRDLAASKVESVYKANILTNPATFQDVRMVVVVDRFEFLDSMTQQLWSTGTPAIGIAPNSEESAVGELVAAIQAAQAPTSIEPWNVSFGITS
jgi:2-amino-4-hydroxy-6-hydroxymethyldihydropteridine diphosphokinase